MTVSSDDRGFTLGDGLFETVLVEAGRLDLWDAHVARLTSGCATLGLPAPQDDVLRREAVAAVARGNLMDKRAAVRISWSAGSGGRGLDRPEALNPTLVVKADAAPLITAPARLVTASVRRNETSPASRLKTLSYIDQIAARREAAARGGDEALMLNTRGLVACAAAANIFWLSNGVLYTPALDCGVLDGVMRGRVMATSPVPVVEVRAEAQALASADAIFLTNSLIGVRAVRALDGRELGEAVAVAQIREAALRRSSF